MTCLTMKFFIDEGEITTLKVDQAVAYYYCNASLEIHKGRKEEPESGFRLPSSSKVMMVDLDA